MEDNLTVLYVAGAGRSGTTIFDRVLGTMEGVVSLNQVYPLGQPKHSHCACGEELSSCKFWQRVSDHSDVFPEQVNELLWLRERVDHSRHLPYLLTSLGRQVIQDPLDRYLAMLQDVYTALARSAGTRILVDSSKVTSRALLLSMIPTIDVYVIHMVRDVRGVIYSWQKKKKRKGGYLTGPGTVNVVKFWLLNNLAAEIIGRRMPYQRVLYEEFSQCPQEVIKRVRSKIPPIADRQGQFIDERTVDLERNHSISGNPDRFQNGATPIRLDEEWKENLDSNVELASRIVTYPLLRRYRYA
jgi:hypothetical protein